MSAAITIELPDLPEPFGEFYSDDRCDTLPDVYTADQMHAYAAEALRQSQSLPAGAVAGLVGKWRERVPADAPDSARVLMREHCADELEQALQADAREKGGNAERYNWLKCGGWEVMQDPRMWPEGLRFDAAIDAGMAMAACGGHATQPAQASEKDNGAVAAHAQRAFKNCIRELRQIQDEAKDYDFDEMTVQALQTGIESIELRLATSSQETASE